MVDPTVAILFLPAVLLRVYSLLMNTVKHMMVSGRRFISAEQTLLKYQRFLSPTLPQVNSVYGFVGGPCRMYAGRGITETYIPWEDVQYLNNRGISFSAVLTNHFVDQDAINESFKVIERLLSMSDRNSIVALNRKYAVEVRKAFPTLIIKQSAIADPRSLLAIERALEVFDLVTLAHTMNDETEFLYSLPADIKSRLVMFLIGGCAYRCEAKTCYTGNSEVHFGKVVTHTCTGKNRGPGFKLLSEFKMWDVTDPIFDNVQCIKLVE